MLRYILLIDAITYIDIFAAIFAELPPFRRRHGVCS